jgi:hypothetical protein
MKVLYSKGLSQLSLVNNPIFASGGNKERTPGAPTIIKCIFNIVNGKENFSLH